MVFVMLRVPHTIESGFDRSLQLSQISFRVHLSALHRWLMLTATHRYPSHGYQGSQWRVVQKKCLASRMGHFGTEMIHHSLFDWFSLSK